MKKIVTILGARPQFIKAATLSRVFQKAKSINEIIIHTGQHYDQNMSDIFFEEMEIPRPNHFLQITSKHHGQMTGRMMEGVEKILLDEKPDAVLVYGDTNSTLAGALAASKLHIPIAHVEAGLRSFNRKMPEEINRVLTDHLSQWLFAPTSTALFNLKNEGITNGVFLTGDVMYDAVKFYKEKTNDRILKELNLKPNDFILATIHRAENTNDPNRLQQIFSLLNKIAANRHIVLPIHPRTKSLLNESINSQLKNFHLIDPVGYLDMMSLQSNCKLVITDSGGVQKEAFLNGKYCVTVRNETEWVELVENGFNFLTDPLETLPNLVEQLWNKPFNDNGYQPYGDGEAANKILTILQG